MKFLQVLRRLLLYQRSRPKPNLINEFGLQGIADNPRDIDIMEQALQRAKSYFRDDAFGPIARAYVYPSGPGPRAMPMAVRFLLSPGLRHPAVEHPPSSVAELLSRISPIFSPDFISHLQDKFLWFDTICGGPVCDALLQAMSAESWATVLVENTLSSVMVPARRSTGRGSNIHDIPQHDGPAPPPPRRIPITQVTLRGATIKDAWANNHAVQQLTAHESNIRAGWSPLTPGGLPIFHGTLRLHAVAHDILAIEDAIATIPTTLKGREGITQLLPPDTPGIYTSFSALRSYIWTAFAAEVISDPPRPTSLGHMNEPIPMRGQAFRGSLVIVFDAPQPAPAGLTSYAVPAGRETQWAGEVEKGARWAGGLRAIHGQDTAQFPDVLHGKDHPRLRHALQGFPCNHHLLWQTAWVGAEGANALNRRTTEALAISFDLEVPEDPEPGGKGDKTAQQPPGDDKDPKPKKRGFRAFTKKVSMGFKGVFGKKDQI